MQQSIFSYQKKLMNKKTNRPIEKKIYVILPVMIWIIGLVLAGSEGGLCLISMLQVQLYSLGPVSGLAGFCLAWNRMPRLKKIQEKKFGIQFHPRPR